MSRDFDAFTNRVNSTLLDLIKQKQSNRGDGGAQQAFQEKAQQLAMRQQKQLGYDAMDARHNALYDKLEQDMALQKVFQGDMMPEQYSMKYGGGIPVETRGIGKTSDVTPYQVQQALQSEYENLPMSDPRKAKGMGAYADKRREELTRSMGGSSYSDVPLEDKIAAFQKRKAEEDAVELINYNLNRVNEYRDSKGNKVDKSTPGATRYVALAGANRELPSTVLAGLNKGAGVPLTDTAKEGTEKASAAPATVPAAQDKPMSYPLGIMGTDAMFDPPKSISRRGTNASVPTGPPAYTSAPMGLDVPYSKPPEAKAVLPTRGPSAALRRATVPAVEPEKSVAKEETWQRRMYKPQPQSQPEVKRNRKVTQSYDELQQFIEEQKRLSRR